MGDRGLRLENEKCTGCRLCEAVCALSHEEKMDLTLSRIRIHPLAENRFQVNVCLQCSACPPSEVCPNEAFLWEKKTGGVRILKEKCDSCGLCTSKCPYSSVFEVDQSVIVCDLCEGDPKCIGVCQKRAIQFIEKRVS